MKAKFRIFAIGIAGGLFALLLTVQWGCSDIAKPAMEEQPTSQSIFQPAALKRAVAKANYDVLYRKCCCSLHNTKPL
jgi:hypothetical protein